MISSRDLVTFFILLILPSFSLAIISDDSTKIYAVTSEGTGLVATLHLQIEPGEGKIWTATTPLVGTSTQNAEKVAVAVARKYSKKIGDYDYKFTIDSPATVVDGPSAGAAMTMLVISMLNERQIPDYVSLTGTINSEGRVGPVGGIFEKAKEASSTGIKLFMIPKGEAIQTQKLAGGAQSVNLLNYAPKNWGMKVVEVATIDDVLKYAYIDPSKIDVNTQASESVPDFIPQKIPLAKNMGSFKILTTNYIRATKDVVSEARSALSSSLLEDADLIHLLSETLNASESTIQKAEILNEQNYLYSAANFSYLARSDAIVVREISRNPKLLEDGSPNFDIRIAELQSELESFRDKLSGNVPKKNVEWYSSAQQRFTYANNSVDTLMGAQGIRVVVVSESGESQQATSFKRLQDYAFAVAWVDVAKDFYNLSQDDDSFVQPSGKFADAMDPVISDTEEKLKQIRDEMSKEDITRRLNASKIEKDANWFEASYFDAASAKALAESQILVENSKSEDLNNILGRKIIAVEKKISDSNVDVGWAKLYLDHAKYFLAAADYYKKAGSDESASDSLKRGISLAYLADEIFGASSKVIDEYSKLQVASKDKASAAARNAAERESSGFSSNMAYLAGGILIALAFAGIVLIVVARHQSSRPSLVSEIAMYKKKLADMESQFIAGSVDHFTYEKFKRDYSQKISGLEGERRERARHLIAYDNYIMDLGIQNEKLKNIKRMLRDGLISKAEFDEKTGSIFSDISSLEKKLTAETKVIEDGELAAGQGQARKSARQKRKNQA